MFGILPSVSASLKEPIEAQKRRRIQKNPSSSLSDRDEGYKDSNPVASSTFQNRENTQNVVPNTPSGQNALRTLRCGSFFLVLSSALVAFLPTPALVQHLGTTRATSLLSVLNATTALLELLLSPLGGRILDSLGRKPLTVGAATCMALAQGWVSFYPDNVLVLCVVKLITTLGLSLAALSIQACLGDVATACRSPGLLGTAIGLQMAVMSAGFFGGTLLAGRLTAYGWKVSTLYQVSAVGMALASGFWYTFMPETLPAAPRIPVASPSKRQFSPWKAPLSWTRILFKHGPKMRILAVVLVLQSFPRYMGDFFQIYATNEWNLTMTDFSSFVALLCILGIASNLCASVLIRQWGTKVFTLLATLSSMFAPLGASVMGFQGMVAGSSLGFLGGAQGLGLTASIVAEGAAQNIPQGELAGERASLLAACKVVGPIWYSALYVLGNKWWGCKNLPFLFNSGLAVAALGLCQRYLS